MIIGLYNIETNGKYDMFDEGTFDFSGKLNSYNSKYKYTDNDKYYYLEIEDKLEE